MEQQRGWGWGDSVKAGVGGVLSRPLSNSKQTTPQGFWNEGEADQCGGPEVEDQGTQYGSHGEP